MYVNKWKQESDFALKQEENVSSTEIISGNYLKD